MKILVVEDEPVSANELRRLILDYYPKAEILGPADSIASTTQFILDHNPELIFMDIELADGSVFEVFNRVEVTGAVIFTTAYDAYALRAFNENGLAYLLKPITQEKIRETFRKIEKLGRQSQKIDFQNLQVIQPDYKTKFLFKSGRRLVPVSASTIAYFHGDDDLVYAHTPEGQTYLCGYSLAKLEELLDPSMFFRINRQYIVNRTAILSLIQHDKGQVKVEISSSKPITEIVSRRKTPELKAWLLE